MSREYERYARSDTWRNPTTGRTRAEQIAHELAASKRRYAERPDRAAILKRDEYRCRYCGPTAAPLAVDHVMPFSRGGQNTHDNLVAACKSCNSRKKDRTPEEAGMKLIPEPERK